MKKYLVIFLSFVCISSFGFGQTVIKKVIPLLKESTQVDSLLVSVFNMPQNMRAPANDSCILLIFDRHNFGAIVGLKAVMQRRLIYSQAYTEKSIGYFEFEGYLIFAYGDESMRRFFTNTNSNKEFNFVKPGTSEMLAMFNSYMSWALFIHDDGELNYGVH
jgi:hypothetical protein